MGFEAGADVGGELVVPALGKAGLQRAGLDGLYAGDGFNQHGLVFCATGKFNVQPLAQDGHDGKAEAKVQRHADQHDQGQWHAVEHHHRNKDD